ncbi:MAG: DEAD/DEAH box helicase family protein [Candidatus Cloacimonetes bacterium]|nr:DEAD/DEAH box helicase family protein [Candidatus Cloacimonadota bacterium]
MKLLSTYSQTPNEWAPWVKTGDRVFYLLSSYSEKDVPKSAGWAFAKETKKLWFTTDYDKACKLADYADGELHKELSAQKIALATNEEKSRKEHSDIELIHPEGLDYKPFQYAGIDFMLSSDKHGILLGDDMGLGKTIQIIGLYNNCERIKNVLIICPNTLKLNWFREFQKWDCRGGKHAIADTKICPLPENGYNVVIVNYEAVSKQNAKLSSVKWDLIGVDEAHYLKNEKTVRYKSIFGSEKYKKINRDMIVFATGTPIPNRVMEIWPLISQCDPDRWNHNTKWKFISKYCGGNPKGYSADDKLNELQKILRQTIMVRRLKKDVLKELPPKMRQVVELEYDEDDKVMIEALNHEKIAQVSGEKDVFEAKVRLELAKAEDNEEEYKAAIANITEVAKIAFQDMAKARYEVAIAKIPYVIQYLENALETVKKVVVFAHHKDVLNTIAKHFGVRAVVIHGDISLQDRQSAVDRFQGDPTVQVAVISIRAGGVGITLTAASTEFFAELDWVPGNILQCEDRCIVKNSLVWCLRSDYINDMILKKIQDVNVGDMVLTHKGNVRKVIDKFTRNHRGMVTKIEYVGWYEPLECTYDHRILVKRDGIVQWVEAYKLLPSDSMCFPKNKNYKKLEKVKIKDEWRLYSEEFYNNYKNKKCSHDGCSNDVVARGLCSTHYRSMLKNKQRPEKPMHVNTRYVRLPNDIVIDDEWLYIFGWFAAKGFSSIAPGKSKFLSFSAHEKEIDVLIKIQNKFSELGIKGTVYSNKKTKGIELRVYSGEIAYWFRDWFGHYAENKKLPIEIMELDPDQAAVFLRGYTDGDGYQRNRQVEWSSASKELCYQMCILTIRSGFIPTMRVAEPKKEHYHHHWYGGYTKFLNCSNIRMQDQDDDYIYRPISKVETRNDKVDVYDLTVEEDHSFTVGFSTVHNCVRIGQESDIVNIYQLVVHGSIDVNMAHKMIEKMHIAEQTLDKVSANIPILPDDDEPATSTINRIRIETELKTFDIELIPVIMQGLQIVAGYDTDYARAKNDMGFNAIDTRIGHDLASKGYLTPKQAILAKKILKKYRKQIPFNIYYNIFSSEDKIESEW